MDGLASRRSSLPWPKITPRRAWHDEVDMLRKHFSILLLCLVPFLVSAGFEGRKENSPARVPSFREEVRPLLQAKCFRCHGDKGRKADLDLRTPAGILEGGESGQVIVPGKPEKSLLYEKVHSGMMPPGKKNRLSETEVETIRRWIAGGTPFGPKEDVKPETAVGAVTQHDALPILLRR